MPQRIDFAALARRALATGISTRALGRELGLSQPAAWRLANGKTKAISADAGVRLIYLAGGSVQLPTDEPAQQAAA